MLVTGTETGIPAPNEAYLAGLYPKPAAQTLPRMTSSTCSGEILAEAKAPLIAIEPNSVALIFDNLPKKVPMGVLFPATM